MKILPAIDILGGKCVRLKQGRYDAVTKYFDDPVEVARNFIVQGANFLHIVDLDGAKDGRALNRELICKIAKLCDVQVGGGIRDFETAASYLRAGVKRVILGTSAFENPELVQEIAAEFGPEALIVSVDVKAERVMLKGWLKDSGMALDEALDFLRELGVERIIVTDVERDGGLEGPNIELYQRVINQGLKVLAAGGISDDGDLKALDKIGVTGAIVGKALYEGKISIKPSSNLCKRIIPCLDIDKGRVVKGVGFKNLQDAGEPVELAKRYESEGADELIFLDISATSEECDTLCELVQAIAENLTIPFTVGGGVRSLEDIDRLLKSGADKVAICSAAIKNPDFIRAAAEQFGSQCLVISLDCKKRETGSGWELYIKGGRENTGLDALEFARVIEELGAGELLVNSLDRDGTKKGFDLKLLRAIASSSRIPVIASSGAGCREDFARAFTEGLADAALGASLFHFGELSIKDLKAYLALAEKNLTIRI